MLGNGISLLPCILFISAVLVQAPPTFWWVGEQLDHIAEESEETDIIAAVFGKCSLPHYYFISHFFTNHKPQQDLKIKS